MRISAEDSNSSKLSKEQALTTLRIISFLLIIAVGYLILKGSHYSKLAGFFVYMSAACSVLPLPTPPYVIGMGKIFNPYLIALLGAFGNSIAAFLEYHFISWLFSRNELQQKIEANKFFQRLTIFFNRAAFPCIVFTGFSPLPVDPFRFTAILTRYFMPKYLLAMFIGKYLRYYLLALLGDSFQIHNRYLVIMLLLLVVFPIVTAFILKRFRAGALKSEKSII